MNEPRSVVLVVGSLNTDLVATADRLPDDGETVIGRSYVTGFGGKGGNQAVMAARLGAAVTMVGAVGDDDLGRAYCANLERERIATDRIARVDGPSGVAPIWVDAAGHNRIIVVSGANDHVSAADGAAAVAAVRPSVVVGQHEIPQAVTAAAFSAARTAGVTTILNPAPAAPIEPELLAATDWLVPNETEFGVLSGVPLTGDDASDRSVMVRYAATVGVSLVVTLGDRGVRIVPVGGEPVDVPAPVVEAIDTTGAGDAFVGAFAVGVALGWPAVDAARLGCAMAADSVTRTGTQRSYADRERAGAVLRTVRDI